MLDNEDYQSNVHNTHIISLSTLSNHSYRIDTTPNLILFEEEACTPNEIMNELTDTYDDQNDEYQIETTNLAYITNQRSNSQIKNEDLTPNREIQKKENIKSPNVKRKKEIKKKGKINWLIDSLSIEHFSFAYRIDNKYPNDVKTIYNDINESEDLNQSLVNEITQNKYDEVSEDEFEKLKTNLVFETDRNMLAENNSNNTSKIENCNSEVDNPLIASKSGKKNQSNKQIKQSREETKNNNSPNKYCNQLSKSPNKDNKLNRNKENQHSRDREKQQNINNNNQKSTNKRQQSTNKEIQHSQIKENQQNISTNKINNRSSNAKNNQSKSKDKKSHSPSSDKERKNKPKINKSKNFDKYKYKNTDKTHKNTIDNKENHDNVKIGKNKKLQSNKEENDKMNKKISKSSHKEKESKSFLDKENKKASMNQVRNSSKSKNECSERNEVRSKSINLLTPNCNNDLGISIRKVCSSKGIDQLAPGIFTLTKKIMCENTKNDIRYHTIQEHPEKTKPIINQVKFSNKKLKNKFINDPIQNGNHNNEKAFNPNLLYNHSTKDINRTKFRLNKVVLQKTRNKASNLNQAHTKQITHKRHKQMNTSISKDSAETKEEAIKMNDVNNHHSNKQSQYQKNINNKVNFNHKKNMSKKLSNASTNLSKIHPTPESSEKNNFRTKAFVKGKPYQVGSCNSKQNNDTQPHQQNNIIKNDEIIITSKLNKIKHKVNTRNKTPTQKIKRMSQTQEDKNQSSINKNQTFTKSHNTIDLSNQPFAQYKAYTCLRDMNKKRETGTQSLSHDKLQSKNIFNHKITKKDDFSQTHMMSFYPQSKRLVSNITQKQFDEKMKYYKRLIKNPLNPYSAYYNKRFLMPQIPQIRYNNKAFSVLMPNLQDKALIKNHSGLRSAKNIHQIKTIYPNMTGHSFWNQSNRMNTLNSKNNNKKQTNEDMNKNPSLIK